MNEIQDFVSGIYTSTLKQTSFKSCFKKLLTNIRVWQTWIIVRWLAVWCKRYWSNGSDSTINALGELQDFVESI